MLAICLATLPSCDGPAVQQMLARSGMGSPMRYDATLIPHLIGKQRFQIPANCYDAPLEVERHVDGYAQTSGALLAMLLPDLECRTKATQRRFQAVGDDNPRINVLIGTIGEGVDRKSLLYKYVCVQMGMARNEDCAGRIKRLADNATDDVSFAHQSDFDRTMHVAFGTQSLGSEYLTDHRISKNDRSYVKCSRRQHRSRDNPEVSTVPRCTLYFYFEDLLVQIDYARGLNLSPVKLETAIRKRLNGFKRA